MYLLVIRHGESKADLLDVHEGRADFELTERGHRQAEAMGKYVASHYQVNKIFASTLKRAAQTAEHLAKETGIDVIHKEDLMEFNNGLLAGMNRKEAAIRYPEIPNLPADQSVYGQESQIEFRNRAEKALSDILQNAKESDVIAIVTHGGMVNQLYRAILHLPVDSSVFFGTGDTGIHVWKLQGNVIRVIKSNMTEHTNGI